MALEQNPHYFLDNTALFPYNKTTTSKELAAHSVTPVLQAVEPFTCRGVDMAKYIILSLPSTDSIPLPLQENQRFTLGYPEKGVTPEVGDYGLVFHTKKQEILPYIFEIDVMNRSSHMVVLGTNTAYTTAVQIATISDLFSTTSAPEDGVTRVSHDNFQTIINRMGGRRPLETEVLNQVKSYISAKGYYFDDETLYNYHISLKTRSLVILAGLSGTGKSKLSQLYAEALGLSREHYLRLAVRPSWNDDRYLLGYLNTITGEYITEPAVDFIMQAGQDDEHLYFFCLDEMNLAHVEYYFSQFLSALEEDDPLHRNIPLLSPRVQRRLKEQGRSVDVPASLSLPLNLLFTGTINVDETTQPISDKVLDRANTIEFFAVDLANIPERRPEPEVTPISSLTWRSYQAKRPLESYRSHIVEIGTILNKADMGLGYRVLREIELYLANSENLLTPQVAFDLQVKQRILPRVRGTEAIKGVLDELIAFTQQNGLPRSEQRLNEMKFRLKRDGYTNFWR
jgi:hypothetical protein